MILTILNLFQDQTIGRTSSDYVVMIGIQLFLAFLFIYMVIYFCKTLKRKEKNKSIKKTCIIIGIMSVIAWFIIAQIVWVITSIQYPGI